MVEKVFPKNKNNEKKNLKRTEEMVKEKNKKNNKVSPQNGRTDGIDTKLRENEENDIQVSEALIRLWKNL
jgi:hypothetical protein